MDTLDIKRFEISEHLRLCAVQTDKFKAGTITFHIAMPVSPKNVAFASVLCGVLKRGNKKYPTVTDVYRRLDELYASSLDVRTSFNSSEISLSLSSELLDNAFAPCGTDILDGIIELISLALLCPVADGNGFAESTVAREVATLRSALLAESNNTQSYALIRVKEMLCRENPNYPTLEALLGVLDDIDARSLWAFYLELVSYSPLDVFYVGGTDAETVAKKLGTYFGSYAPTKSFSQDAKAPDAPLQMSERSEQMSVSQSKLALGFHSSVNLMSTDYHAAILFNEIFGASPISKLFVNVREKMGLCYYCGSSYNTFSGALIVSSGIEGSRRELAEREILAQLDTLKRGEISDAELAAAKKSLINVYRQIYDNPFDISNFHSSRMRLGIDESIEDCISAFDAVSLEDIVRVAKTFVHDTTFFIEGTSDGDEKCEVDEYDE